MASTELVIFRLGVKHEHPDASHVRIPGKKLDSANRFGIANPFKIEKPTTQDNEGKQIVSDEVKKIVDKYFKDTDPAGTRKELQYIVGCNTFEPLKQKEGGWVFNPTNDWVGFVAGSDIILNPEEDAILIEMLRIHPSNPKSPFALKRGLLANNFFEYVRSVEVKQQMSVVELEDKAIAIVNSGKGKEKELKTLARIFGVNTEMATDDIYLQLRQKAKDAPELFLQIYKDGSSEKEATIKQAEELKIIHFETGGIYWTEQNSLILKTSKQMAGKIKDLLEYFETSEGGEIYKSLYTAVQNKDAVLT